MHEKAVGRAVREGEDQEGRRMRHRRFNPIMPVSFYHNGMVYEALMSDVSERGAQLQIPHYRPSLGISKGTELTIEMSTPRGRSVTNGVVRWVKSCAGRCQWGVEFTESPRRLGRTSRLAMSQ